MLHFETEYQTSGYGKEKATDVSRLREEIKLGLTPVSKGKQESIL